MGFSLSLYNINIEKIKLIKFLENAFSKVGRFPANFTNAPMQAKLNDEKSINKTALTLFLITTSITSKYNSPKNNTINSVELHGKCFNMINYFKPVDQFSYVFYPI